MSKIRIVTDSTSDISIKNDMGITVLPMKVRFGDTEYRDGVDLSTTEFYEKLAQTEELPSTSLVSPAEFEDEYIKAKENGETLLVITCSSKLSGTHQSASLTAQDYDNVYVVDSKTVTVGESILVSYAKELVEKGMEIEDIVRELEEKKEKIQLIVLLDTLKYLQKGGRISTTTAFVGDILSIKPVVAVRDGVVCMLGKARGFKKGSGALTKEIEDTSGIDWQMPVRFAYSGTEDTLLKKYIELSAELWQGRESTIEVSNMGPTIGTYAGFGAVAVAFFGK